MLNSIHIGRNQNDGLAGILSMKISRVSLVKGTLWTAGCFGVAQILRIMSSVILAKLLSPEIFGAMVIIYSLKTGIDLITDVGIGQSIVSNKNAENPDFYDTAWTLRLVRGLFLSVVCWAIAVPLARVYDAPIIATILPVVGLNFTLASVSSLSTILWQKRLQTIKLSIFDLVIEIISTIGQILFAYFYPTIWALVFGLLFYLVLRAVGSFLIMPTLRHRVYISTDYVHQIFAFGKWIFLSSLIFFLSANFDRLYLGKEVPLETLGIYGIARNLIDVINSLFTRLNFVVIFPFIAAHIDVARYELRRQIFFARIIFLFAVAVGVALLASTADLIIDLLYDHRYHSSGWMLSVLAIGSWFSILATVNESSLLGFGKPLYGAFANTLKLVWLIIGVPLLVVKYGIGGVVAVVAGSDACRYIPILIGQKREHFGFFRQDLLLTMSLIVLICVFEGIRLRLGIGASFQWLTMT